MPFRTIPDTDQKYALISFDKSGVERPDDPDGLDGLMSKRLIKSLKEEGEPYTDVFFMSHGWKGDVDSAIDQYNRWFKAMLALDGDQRRAKQKFGAFKPLRVGLHWPSQPWGNEEQPEEGASFDPAAAMPVATMVEKYVERLGDSPEIRESLRIIFDGARRDAAAEELPPDVDAAYRRLNSALDMGEDAEGAAPGDDREPFDPQRAFENGNEEASFGDGGSIFAGVLGPLRQLSFWTMKKRARTVGEGAIHAFLRDMQRASERVRVHLMGHSFGCIVVSSMLRGPGKDATPLVRPVDTAALIQGALSLWSYCPDIPKRHGTPGYFHDIVRSAKVRGPIVTTQSKHDTAVGKLYPIAAGIARQVDFAPGDLPEYGGLGSFGARGLNSQHEDVKMLDVDGEYNFKLQTIYNVESSKFIATGSGASGAHSDIDGPQVAHMMWQSVIA
jgi:hypothetical protein